MPHRPDPKQDPSAPEAHDDLIVLVERSGGFAGISRHWRVLAPVGDTQWRSLVEQCPWVEAATGASRPPRGADRFAWSVTAACGDTTRRAHLSEQEVAGPWRALIDAVRLLADSAADSAGAAGENSPTGGSLTESPEQ